jgi:hypothetical protein
MSRSRLCAPRPSATGQHGSDVDPSLAQHDQKADHGDDRQENPARQRNDAVGSRPQLRLAQPVAHCLGAEEPLQRGQDNQDHHAQRSDGEKTPGNRRQAGRPGVVEKVAELKFGDG